MSENQAHDIVEQLRDSSLDIVVHEGDGEDIFVKADDSVIHLHRSEASILIKELQEALE